MPTPTPNPVDQYTRFFVNIFDSRTVQATPRSFQSFFGNPAGGGLTIFELDQALAEIEIIKADGEKLAPLVHRGQSSTPIDVDRITDYEWSNIGRVWPLAELLSNINSAKLLLRNPGDNPYARRTQLDRARQKARDLHYEHMRRLIRLFEYLASVSILTGKQPVIKGTTNTDLIYDFYRLASHTIGVPVAWDTGSADIIADIDNALDVGRADSYRTLDFMAIGGTAMAAFTNDDNIQKLADNLRFELINIDNKASIPQKYKRYIDAGWIARARLVTYQGREIYIFCNNDVYTDEAGATVNYMPLDKAFLLSTEARFDRHFGPRDRLPVTPMEVQWYQQMFGMNMMAPMLPPNTSTEGNIIVPEAFFFDAYPGKDKKNVTMRTQAAPIFATTETDAIVVLEDLITP